MPPASVKHSKKKCVPCLIKDLPILPSHKCSKSDVLLSHIAPCTGASVKTVRIAFEGAHAFNLWPADPRHLERKRPMAVREDVARLKGLSCPSPFIGNHLQMANCQSSRAFAPPIYCFSICSTSAKKSLNAAMPPVRRPAETIFDLIISSEIRGFGEIRACAFSTASSKVFPVPVKVFAFFFFFRCRLCHGFLP